MKTIEYYADVKNKLIRAANNTTDPRQKREWLTAFNRCDRKIGQLLKWYRQAGVKLLILVIVVNLAVLISICGCNSAKASLNLGGAVLQDTGWALTKMSENITVQKK